MLTGANKIKRIGVVILTNRSFLLPCSSVFPAISRRLLLSIRAVFSLWLSVKSGSKLSTSSMYNSVCPFLLRGNSSAALYLPNAFFLLKYECSCCSTSKASFKFTNELVSKRYYWHELGLF